MAIDIKFDLNGNPEPPSIILANRNGNKLGQLDVNVDSIELTDKFNDISEMSFTVNKFIDGEITPLWNKLVDFKLIYCPEWDFWFEAKVELDEATESVKTVFCTQLGQAELSQIMLYNIEINTEDDIARDDYKSSILYDELNTDASILHRILDKAPHYSIAHVDDAIARIGRQFSFDGTSICDALNEIAEEIGCLVIYNSNSDKNGMPNRTISVYDLQQNCNNKDCRYRGEFIDKCPKCESTDITYGYGEDTAIFVTSDEIASEGIQFVTDTDSVKNCFKLEAGDDLMTATIRNCNPNGSDYIWRFSDRVKEDMSKELVAGIEGYDAKYQEFYKNRISVLDEDLVSEYNRLVKKYKEYYDTDSVCISCDHEGEFEDECPICHSSNIITGEKLEPINSSITGYPALMNAYYNTIDLSLYLQSSLMPNIEMSDTNAEKEASLLTASSLSPVAVNVDKVKSISKATADSAVLSMAKVLVRSTYKIEIISSTLDDKDENDNIKEWRGTFKITNYSNEGDTATVTIGNDAHSTEYVLVNNNTEKFINQKLDKALNKEDTDDYSISGLFEKRINLDDNGEHIVDENGKYICINMNENGDDITITSDSCRCEFCTELEKYALIPLKTFYDACDGCLNILIDQGVGEPLEEELTPDDLISGKQDLYKKLYLPYRRKSDAIGREMEVRENEISIIDGVYKENDDGTKVLDKDGLKQNIEKRRNEIQKELDFENYLSTFDEDLGRNLWLEFCSYRREDKYSNSNYVSDGLNNAELFKMARDFIEVAENEIYKSSELQHSISTTLNNLLAIPKFKPLVKSFKNGNWIRIQADDNIYKLRLLEYSISFSDFNTISVEFSDVTKIKNSVSDIESVLSQASSVVSSYDAVQRQAKKGDVARSTIDQWVVDGLNAANVQIQNNNNEEVLLTKNGLLARSYNDINGDYSPEQLKITHNIMAYTDDNWETVKQSIGKHEYNYFNKSEGKLNTATGYGMNADFAVASIISGSQIIGGDIYSTNYTKKETIDENGEKTFSEIGSHINLETGSFSLAGGRLTYDGEETLSVVGKMEITDSGKIACWDIDKYALYKNKYPSHSSELSFYNADTMYFGEQGLSLSNQFKVEPNGVATMTNANVSGTIMGSNILGNNYLFIGDVSRNDDGEYIKNYDIDYTEIDNKGKLTCTNADISGTIKANYGLIGGFHIYDNNIYAGEIDRINDVDILRFGEDSSVFLSVKDMGRAEINNATDFFDDNIENWRFTIGNNFGVTSDGSLYSKKGCIGGWKITDTTLESTYGGLTSGFQVDNGNGGINALAIGSPSTTDWTKAPFRVEFDGALHATEAIIKGEITATKGVFSNCTIDDTCTVKGNLDGATGSFSGWVTATGGTFNNVNINTGNIGGWDIKPDGLYSEKDGSGTGFQSPKTGTWAIAVNYDDSNSWSNAAFRVNHSGQVYIEPSNSNWSGLYILSPRHSSDVSCLRFNNSGMIFAHNKDSNSYYGRLYMDTDSNMELINNSGRLGITANDVTIKSTVQDAETLLDVWKFRLDASETIITGTKGVDICSASNERVRIRLPSSSNGTAYWYGTWEEGSGIVTTSDKNKKNSIADISDKYSLFFDLLRSVVYKYNDGTSNRLHTGLIAQEVDEALKIAGITRQEFAGVCIDNEGTSDESWGLRYGEFISLCINEIQKLKLRVLELENKLIG